jgi:hypothetical protein
MEVSWLSLMAEGRFGFYPVAPLSVASSVVNEMQPLRRISMYVQPLENFGPTPLAPLAELTDGAFPPAQQAAGASGDAISRLIPPFIDQAMLQNPMQTAMFGPLASLMQQLMQMLQSMMGSGSPYGGCPVPYGGGGSCAPYGGEQFFGNANGASTGDPHLSFNGNHWDSMVSQPDLLNSDSIPGGFAVSTQVTPPNARGVTWNQSATVSLNNGQTTISLNNAGQPSIQSFGRNVPIAEGQTIQLGNGASVTCNGNGWLTVNAQSGYGGQIATTLTAQGQGVNVEASAQNVDLGGALVNGNQMQPGPISGTPIIGQPVYGPPGFGPIQNPFPVVSPPPLTPISSPVPAPIPSPISGPIIFGPIPHPVPTLPPAHPD